ncbi:MAG: glycosyltransferase [Gammaproteobacteria bacterium]|nr:glycosyltransferase [Gammaproteobacteria bacterium]
MNILMLTNTFTPHVGGVARSVASFAGVFRELGHRVLVAAPRYENTPEREEDVIRFPAVQRFRGSDFSVPMPVPGRLSRALRDFKPDIAHSHHPFLLGDSALRIAATFDIPVVFTHHTRYELYTHYVPGDSPTLRRLVIELVTGYCDLCDAVIAPSESIAALLRNRGVTTPIETIPTGVDSERFAAGDGLRMRSRLNIPANAFVVGHVGRLAPEKNLEWLARAVAFFARAEASCHFLVAGDGPMKSRIAEIFNESQLADRVHIVGTLERSDLADAYHAMDVFAFCSRSETQGLVLIEAMAAGRPVVAIDAAGTSEVVIDGVNGRLLPDEDVAAFADALSSVSQAAPDKRDSMSRAARETAESLSLPRMAQRCLSLYERLIGQQRGDVEIESSAWDQARRRFGEEWKIFRNLTHAVGEIVQSPPGRE